MCAVAGFSSRYASRQEERARRQKARPLIADYHEQQLLALLEHVRDGFTRLDRSEIDAFELDELIHRAGLRTVV
jgi:hypothetical protein